jgi:hypothetical protein
MSRILPILPVLESIYMPIDSSNVPIIASIIGVGGVLITLGVKIIFKIIDKREQGKITERSVVDTFLIPLYLQTSEIENNIKKISGAMNREALFEYFAGLKMVDPDKNFILSQMIKYIKLTYLFLQENNYTKTKNMNSSLYIRVKNFIQISYQCIQDKTVLPFDKDLNEIIKDFEAFNSKIKILMGDRHGNNN